jgi:DNA (cytosine-5)-methyltransferase 1
MRYGSVCSGIEAATMAWHPLGWKAQWFSEIEPFPSAVLQHHYPEVPNLGDMTLIHSNPIFNETTIDVLVGGTPCQSFSVAGLRKGMEDPRGNLALEFCRIANIAKPQWIVWENVPGVLSSNGGKDFASLLGALGELGYGFAYRILDAQHFGVPQRRRRIFLVGYLGDWRPAAAVLFESESLCRNTAESRSKREKVTRAIEASITNNSESGEWWDGGQTAASLTTRCHDQYMPDKGHFSAVIQKEETKWLPQNNSETIGTLRARDYKGIGNDDLTEGRGLVVSDDKTIVSETTALCFKVRGGVSENSGSQGGVPGKSAGKGYLGSEEKAFTIATSPDQWLFEDKSVAVDMYNMSINEKTSQTLSSSASDINHTGGTITNSRVRRLTPIECERLQGFPDDFSNIPYRGKSESPDGPRYKALGNSMAVPVMAWIGKRIQEVQNILENK